MLVRGAARHGAPAVDKVDHLSVPLGKRAPVIYWNDLNGLGGGESQQKGEDSERLHFGG